MKKIFLSSLASVGVIAMIGCADNQTATTTTQQSYSVDSTDSKNMTPVTTEAPPPPPPVTNAVPAESDESGGIHSSGNMGGER